MQQSSGVILNVNLSAVKYDVTETTTRLRPVVLGVQIESSDSPGWTPSQTLLLHETSPAGHKLVTSDLTETSPAKSQLVGG